MKKLILSIIIGVLIAFSSHADEKLNQGSWWEQVPTICISNESLWEYAKRKEMQPLNVSYGRTGGRPDGEVVYIVTYWVGIDTDETMASVMTPNSNYSCILFRTFDVQLNPGFDFNPKPDI